MNGKQITETSLLNETPRLELTPAESQRRPATGFMHPDDVLSDCLLTHAEKREILASWASDVRAVPNAPALRQLDNGGGVRIDDVLQALNSLDQGEATAFDPFRSYAGPRFRLPHRLKSALRWGWTDDDDDPPPCPTMVAKPSGGPLSGGGAAQLGLALLA